jgi:competence protein ComEC
VARHAEALRADVVIVPHHGSRTSSTPPFVRAVGAEVAIAGAGFDNRWGFPRPEVVKRWQDAGAMVLDTGGQGAVSVRFSAHGLQLQRFRDRRRLWREPAGLVVPPDDSLSTVK